MKLYLHSYDASEFLQLKRVMRSVSVESVPARIGERAQPKIVEIIKCVFFQTNWMVRIIKARVPYLLLDKDVRLKFHADLFCVQI